MAVLFNFGQLFDVYVAEGALRRVQHARLDALAARSMLAWNKFGILLLRATQLTQRLFVNIILFFRNLQILEVGIFLLFSQ